MSFSILLLLFYLNGCCAYSHVHTKRSFHEISRLYDNKYNTSNYYIDAYVKTHEAPGRPRKQLYLLSLSNNLFSLLFSFHLSSRETHPLLGSFSLKLKTHHLLFYTMWPNVRSEHLRITNGRFKLQYISAKSPLASLVYSLNLQKRGRIVVYMVQIGKWYDRMNGEKRKLSEKAISLLRLNLIWSGGGSKLQLWYVTPLVAYSKRSKNFDRCLYVFKYIIPYKSIP